MFEVQRYLDGDFPLPDRDNPNLTKEQKRDKDYCKRMCEHFYSSYIKGDAYFTKAEISNVFNYRLYANGMQSEDKYKDSFLGKVNNGSVLLSGQNPLAARKAYANIDFSIMSPMPRIKDAVISMLKASTNSVSVDAIDSKSGAEKENLKWGTYVDGRYRTMFETLNAIAGLPQKELGYTPENPEELNLYDAEGGFKLDYAVAMEELVKNCMDGSRWDDELFVDITSDLIDCGFTIVEDTYDKNTGQVGCQYRDPANSGVQYTRESQYDKPDWGFSVVMVKINEIRREFPDVPENAILSIAELYADKFGNGNLENWNRLPDNYGYSYDDTKVPVLKAKWIDVEYDHEIQSTNKVGKIRTFPDEGKPLWKKDKRITTRKKMLYEASWLIDSEYVYDFGPSPFQARNGMSEPVLPFHAVKVKSRPIVARVIPALDLFQNSWLKLQHGISMAALNGFSVNLDVMSNMVIGGQKISPLEAIKIWRQTGFFFYKGTNAINLNGSSPRGIDSLAGGAGPMIQDAMSGMEVASKMIEETTGINPVTLGSSPQKDQGKGVTEFAIQGTSNVLSGIVSRINTLKSDVARNNCLRLQLVVHTDKKAFDRYKNAIGETRMELLKIAEGHDVKYGVKTQVRPTEQEIQEIFEMINLSLKNGRDGKVGITEADAVRFKDMVHSGASLKRIAQLLGFAIKKAQEQLDQREKQNQILNSQLGQQTEQAKAKLDIQALSMKKQIEQEAKRNQAVGKILEKAYDKGDKDLTYVLNALGILTPEQQKAMAEAQQQQGMQGQGQSPNPATEPAPSPQTTAQGEPTNIPGK